MNIVFVHSHKFRKINGDIYSLGGLSNKVLERYSKYCDKLIVIARIINEEYSKDNYSKITCNKVEIYDIKDIKLNGLKKYIKQSNFNIIRLPCIIGNIAIKYVRKYKKRYLIESVGCAWDAFWNHGFSGKIIAPFIEYFTKKDIRCAENVLYVSREFLPMRYPNTNNWISCSDVELSKISNEVIQNRKKRIANTNFSEKKIILATIGAVNVKYKGQQYVIKAIEKLKKQGYKITYLVIGSGNNNFLCEYSKKLGVNDSVIFKGSLEHSKVFDLLDNIDIYIQPSNQEGLCRALIEAMSRGCPCIASNVGGNPELIDKKFIFKSKNIRNLEEKIKLIYTKENLLNQSKVNFEKASKYYSKEVLDKNRDEFYSSIINSLENGE